MNVGDWPYCPHGRAAEYRPFKEFIDYDLDPKGPVKFSNWGDVLAAKRKYKVDFADTEGPAKRHMERALRAQEERRR